jgi:outer membrane protein
MWRPNRQSNNQSATILNRPSSLRRRLVFVLAAAAAAGCVDQQKEVANYRKVLEGPTPPSVRVDYTHGEELTLEAALLLANTGSEQLSIQGETFLQSLISRDRAYSTFMPTISLAPTLNWQNRKLSAGSAAISTGATGSTGTGAGNIGTGAGTGTLSAGSGRGYYTYSVPVAARVNLFNGFRDVATLQANQFNVQSQKNTLLNLQATVLLETAQSYYNVLLAERSVLVLSKSADYQDALVADQKARLGAGIAQPLDVAQSEAQAAATRATLITAEDSVKTNRSMLEFLTNAKVQKATLVDRLEVPEHPPSIEDAVSKAEAQRLDILAAAQVVRVEQQNLQAAIGEYYPTVSLDLNYYLHRTSFPTNVEWAGIITATVPIFSAGEIRADVRNAMSQLRVAVYNEWQLIRQVKQNVQIDWDNLEASKRRIAELQIETAASQEALRQAVQRYGAGLAINLDVLNAETQLLNSQLSLAQEDFNYKVFYLDLLRDTGQLPLPAGLKSMSSGTRNRPTTEELQPVAPTVPGRLGMPGDLGLPLTAPATQPMSQPAETQPSPATYPAIDFSLQPDVGSTTQPTTLPAVFPTTFPTTAPAGGMTPRRRRHR